MLGLLWVLCGVLIFYYGCGKLTSKFARNVYDLCGIIAITGTGLISALYLWSANIVDDLWYVSFFFKFIYCQRFEQIF